MSSLALQWSGRLANGSCQNGALPQTANRSLLYFSTTMIRRRPTSFTSHRHPLTRTLTDVSLSPTNSEDGKYEKKQLEDEQRCWRMAAIAGLFRILTITVAICYCWKVIQRHLQQNQALKVVFVDSGKRSTPLVLDPLLPTDYYDDDTNEPDYGGLHIKLLRKRSFYRKIQPHDNFQAEYEQALNEMDKIRHGGTPINTWEEISIDNSDPCVPPRWTFENNQACNIVHEINAPTYQLLGRGNYRDAFLYQGKDTFDDNDFVMKKLLLKRDLNQRQLFKVNREALIMEKLARTGSVGALYGHCGSTVLVERGHDLSKVIINAHELQNPILKRGYFAAMDLVRLNEDNDGFFQNNELSPQVKLHIALAIVKSITLLHGFPGGAIAHDDISLDQWMLGTDNRVILNDFNSIQPLDININSNHYCRFHSRSGNFKAPEYFDSYRKLVTEASDVWSIGLVIYAILTGLMPYHNAGNLGEVDNLIAMGSIPLLSPILRQRSFIEERLSEAMDRCLVRDPDQRAGIFWVLDWLHETKDMHIKHGS